MTDDLRRRLKESVGTQAEVPVDEIIARGRDRRRRLRQGWLAGSGLVVVAIVAAGVVLSRAPTTHVHVTGGPTPSTTSQPTQTLSSSPGSPLPSCQPDQYQLDIGVAGETSAGLAIEVQPTLVKGSPCRLAAQAQLLLHDSAGRALAVTGNPSTAAISGQVAPGIDETTEFPNQFFWSNWCGARSPDAGVQISLKGQGVSVTRTSSYPICVTQRQRSTLIVINSAASPTPPPPTSTGSSSSSLVTTSPPSGGFTLLVPSGWQFVDESYPSDHGTYVWYNPQDKQQRIEIVGSGCAGCVSNITGTDAYTIPVPTGGLPAASGNPAGPEPVVGPAVDSTTPVSACQLNFHSTTFQGDYTAQLFPPSSLPDNGRVLVSRLPTGRVTGFARIDVWLPASEQAEAQQIAGSLREALSGGASVC